VDEVARRAVAVEDAAIADAVVEAIVASAE
jgi:hypothetical protein